MSYFARSSTRRTTGVVLVLALIAVPAIALSRSSRSLAVEPELACATTETCGRNGALQGLPAESEQGASPAHTDADRLDDIVRAGAAWRLETPRGPVHVWVPAGYEPSTATTVVFVHGYNTDVDTMWTLGRLPQQFALSGVNAMFIACGAPISKGASMVWPSLAALLKTVEDGIDQPLPKGRVVAIGHSGAYRTIVLWLANAALQTVVLLDGAYGELDRFPQWVRASASHRFINIAYETQAFSEFMHRAMPATRRVDGLPAEGFPEDARRARVLYVRTAVGHWPLVTDGLALPLALRALDAPLVPGAPLELPLGFTQ